ncbi:MAG: peptidase S8 [Anaerolineales bacterium]|nr:peptidase S8 [Anaerolineae bacterium]PWB49541.1 MAG: peptidase S8 [Anaerolineales bacterium]
MIRNYLYSFLALLTIFSVSFAGAAVPASAAAWRTKVDPWVLQTAASADTEFLVYLTIQADLSTAHDLPTRLEKGRYVFQALTATANRTQAPLITYLENLGLEYKPFWIANMIWVRGNLSAIQLLASRLDVAHLFANPSVTLDAPVESASSSFEPQSVEWNISKVNVPAVWALGYNGQGVVIGGQDTGYAWSHSAIENQYRGWDGAQADHNYNWYDATADHSPTPIDPYGHGTHTMGIMLGDDGAGNQIGMAPGARWIGCRNMDASGTGSPATYSTCYQWFVAPTDLNGENPRPDLAPDVINNSWGCPPSEGCTDPAVILTVVRNLVAAGIVTTHSAGNSGSSPPSGCGTVNTPAAIYDESFTVGATNSSDTIASFSSIGPVTVDGSHRPKPDISAPGVNVRSCIPGGGYGWKSGTSMAAPHVAGLVALLISASPNLRGQVDEIESIIDQSAYHISWAGCDSSGVPNNAYGWGRIDALAALQFLHTLVLGKVASESSVMPGDLIPTL